MVFVESPAFTRHLSHYLNEGSYSDLQVKLTVNPDLGDVMPATGGFRKLRWADARRGKGRRGGLRIIYYHFKSDSQIWLVTLYHKNEAADLTSREKKALKASIENEVEMRSRAKKTCYRQGRIQ